MLKKYLVLILGCLLFSVGAQAQTIGSLFHNANDPVAGNPKGKITIVEFFDYQCSHCQKMAPVIDETIRANPNVRVVFKEFPIRGDISTYASRAALAAKKQGKYYPFSHALLITNRDLSKDTIIEIAGENGLNIDKLKKDMDSSSVKNQLAANRKLGQELRLSGTPAFFIAKTDTRDSNNINYILGSMSQSELQSAIDNAK